MQKKKTAEPVGQVLTAIFTMTLRLAYSSRFLWFFFSQNIASARNVTSNTEERKLLTSSLNDRHFLMKLLYL